MEGIKIVSTGYYVPPHVVTNDDFAKKIDTSDEWISTRTGIKTRHFSEGEDTTDLAYKACEDALKDIDKKDVGMILVASITNKYFTPSTACLLQERLGLDEEVFALDINAACSGFEYALTLARSYMQFCKKKYAIVVGAETLSSIIDFTDRSTCVLFGDGAGAVVLEKADALYLDYHGAKGQVDPLYASREEGYMRMQGREVFRFATSSIANCIEHLTKEANLTYDDIDYFVLHQANGRIISHVYKKLKIPSEKFYINLDRYGNTSGASVPLALAEMNEKGMLKRGMKIMLVGFGGGLAYGANLLEW